MGKGKRIRNKRGAENEFKPFGVVVNDGQPTWFFFDKAGNTEAVSSGDGRTIKNSVSELGLTSEERLVFDMGQGYGFLQIAWLQYLVYGNTVGIQACKDFAGDAQLLQSFVEPVLNDTAPKSWAEESVRALEAKKDEFRKLIAA